MRIRINEGTYQSYKQPFFRSNCAVRRTKQLKKAGVAELVDARDLKSRGSLLPCRFDPDLRHLIKIP